MTTNETVSVVYTEPQESAQLPVAEVAAKGRLLAQELTRLQVVARQAKTQESAAEVAATAQEASRLLEQIRTGVRVVTQESAQLPAAE